MNSCNLRQKPRKVCVVLVDRANYGRLKPVMRAIHENPELKLQVIAAGAMVLERFGKPVDVVRRERLARLAAEERASRAEAQMREHQSVVEQVEKELGVLRAERDHVRERVDRLLGQLDALEL